MKASMNEADLSVLDIQVSFQNILRSQVCFNFHPKFLIYDTLNPDWESMPI